MKSMLPTPGKTGALPVCRNVHVAGRRTSVRMERVMWEYLKEIGERERLTVNDVCGLVDGCRGEGGLTAGLRVFIVGYLGACLVRPVPGEGIGPLDRALAAFGRGPSTT
jgi:predicted DNA-binding ribbon-helix-helix protein